MKAGRRSTLAAVGVLVALAACGTSSPASSSTATPTPGGLTGSLTVFAAASLTEPLTDDRRTLTAANPSLDLTFSFAGSQQLVAQLQAGAPADVVATADQSSMQKLVDANLVDRPQVFARNVLEIAVGSGNPKGIHGLADLARSDLRVVLAAPTVPAGKYGNQALDRAGVKVSPVSLELDVKSALQKVEAGEADAAIVYVTDVRSAGARAAGVEIPVAQNVVSTYPVAVVKAGHSLSLARTFVDQLLKGAGRKALRGRGFLDP